MLAAQCVLLVALFAAPAEPQDLPAAEVAAAYEAGDIGRLTRLWSAHSPTRSADRTRVARLLTGSADLRLHRVSQAAPDVLRLDLHAAAGTLAEQYDLRFQLEEGVWRAWSLTTLNPDGIRELLHRAAQELDTGAVEQSFATYNRAMELAHDDALRAAVLRGLGNVFHARGEIPAAIRHYEQSVELARSANDRAGIAKALDRLAMVDRVTGDYERGAARWAEALQIFRETGGRGQAARALNGLGSMRSMEGDYLGARTYYDEALQIYEAIGDAVGLSAVLNNLAIDEQLQGRYREAVAMYHRAEELSRSIDDQEGLAYALVNRANTQTLLGEYREALPAHQEALAIFERLGSAETLPATYVGLGGLYRILGNVEQARAYFEKALAVAEKLGFKEGLSLALHNLGLVSLQEGQTKRALDYYARALAIDEELENHAALAVDHQNIGRAHFLAGNTAEARRAFGKGLEHAEKNGDRENMTVSLTGLTEVAETKDEAIAIGRRATALATELGLPERIWEARLALGQAYRRYGLLGEARTEVEGAVQVIEDIRREIPGEELAQQQAFESLVRPYHDLIGILVEQGDAAGAFEQAERAKGRVLLDVLRNGRPDLQSALTAAEREREAALAAEAARLSREHREAILAGSADANRAAKLRAARLAYDAFIDGVYAAHPQLRMEGGDLELLHAADLPRLLAAAGADALVEFVVTEERTYAFSMTPETGLRVQTLPVSHAKLEEEVRRFRELLANRDVTYSVAARALYGRLFRPFAAQLASAKTICIVADGPLWELPFQALQPAAGEFVLDRHAVFYAPSVSVLREMSTRRRETAKGATQLLAFGNPLLLKASAARSRDVARDVLPAVLRDDLRDAPLAPLPQTETEIRSIASLYGARNSRIHLGGDAREELVKAEAGAYDVLHFATHGVLDDRNALYSRLVFSPSGSASEDGLLEAREIMRLDLRADLAVLSACETARGRVGAGEGLIGMSWALSVAGVPTSVVSQWKVDSSSTTELMIEFHRQLRERGVTKAEALRRAALRARAKAAWRHPFYWAPFVVVGSAR